MRKISPQDFEDTVRFIASLKWSRKCAKETISGVEIDGVIQLEHNQFILIQITQNERLDKFRKDILDLELVRNSLFTNNHAFANCYLITEEAISSRMQESARNAGMTAMTVLEFRKEFFDFEAYRIARVNRPFGSATSPETGEVESNIFIPVSYGRRDGKGFVNYDELIKMIINGKKVILKGEYGTGKSRVIQSLFNDLTQQNPQCYFLAIDLRDYKGVEGSDELIRRHLRKIGLSRLEDSGIKCLNSGVFFLLIDGFDEIAMQSWSDVPQKISDIRYREFAFLREVVKSTKKGMLITGRDHFFNDDNEMLKAFGLREDNCVIIESLGEFSEEEIDKFKSKNGINLDLPQWFPRKPMAVRLLSENANNEEFRSSLKLNDPYLFWVSFFEYIAERDANANQRVLDSEAIKKLLIAIARFIRTSSEATGPVSLEDLNFIFKREFGFDAVEESAAYLQRLPGLGRVAADSYDRKFTDDQFLNFLMVQAYSENMTSNSAVDFDARWRNVLSKSGIILLSSLLSDIGQDLRGVVGKYKNIKNVNMLGELISAALYNSEVNEFDFNNLSINGMTCSFLDFSEKRISNLFINDSYLYELMVVSSSFSNLKLKETHISKLFGVSSISGISEYVDNSCVIDSFEQISSIAKIKKTKLSPAQQYLVLMIQKVFNQKGAGRKESVLMKGFNGIYDKKLAEKIIGYLLTDGFFIRHSGDEGFIYKGNGKVRPRAEKILEELTLSKDELWQRVSHLSV